jgi:branched-chain amino acid aminotransferase
MPPYAYFQKKFIPLAEAKVGIMTHALHYGTAVFEGIRGNWNSQQEQIYLFRLKEHYTRLLNGCKVLRMELPYTVDDFCQITVELVKKSGIKEDLYVRPLAYKSSEALGVRLHNLDADFFAYVIPWGKYIDTDTCKCGVSSWRRMNSNMASPRTKITGQYVTSAFAKTEAIENGFDEAILLTEDGHVSEGSGENIFLVIDGKLVTPTVYNGILMGITRSTVIELAKNELGIETIERSIERTELYNAQEVFLTGAATRVQPVAEIDHRKIADGEIGPITGKLQKIYDDVIRGNKPKYLHWCTPAYKKSPVVAKRK